MNISIDARVCSTYVSNKQAYLHIASTSPISRSLRMTLDIVMSTLKLTKYSNHGFSHHIRQHIQPSTMWHTNNETMRAQFRRTINGILQGRDNRLPPIQTKSFRGIEFISKEVLKGIREAQSFKDVHLLLSVHLEKIGILDTFTYPIALMR